MSRKNTQNVGKRNKLKLESQTIANSLRFFFEADISIPKNRTWNSLKAMQLWSCTLNSFKDIDEFYVYV